MQHQYRHQFAYQEVAFLGRQEEAQHFNSKTEANNTQWASGALNESHLWVNPAARPELPVDQAPTTVEVADRVVSNLDEFLRT